ncbi:glycosyltransferase [Bosea sp. AAP35]|uniref:glycosyltransferase family 2 protein n=1 Tax=Bosea sp. AAP35 TaxID=1523417 RepID=UPI000A730A86|nr:glycosyltransferase [Bosea sp. AAP35]
MSVAVLTIVKDRGEHLRQVLAGLARSDRAPDEVVIVDMGLHPLDIPTTGLPITVLRLPDSGLPLAKARNRAARHAQADNLIFLDVDCIPANDLIGRLGMALDGINALICADVRYLPANPANSSWSEAALHEAGHAHPARIFPDEGLRAEPNPGLFWSLAFGVRKMAFDTLGGFDERFTGYGGEDTDFGFRARAAGLPLLFLGGGAGAFHQHHGVYDPPLQHVADIVRNAGLFREIWGVWPMGDWLARFNALGLIDSREDGIALLRLPTHEECEAARKPGEARF